MFKGICEHRASGFNSIVAHDASRTCLGVHDQKPRFSIVDKILIQLQVKISLRIGGFMLGEQ